MSTLNKMCVILIGLLIGNGVAAQNDEINYKKMTISVKQEGTSQYEYIRLTGEEALEFDVPKYINENIEQAEIRIMGTFVTEDEKIKVDFNSKDFVDGDGCIQFCEEVVQIDQIAMLGVSMKQKHDFEGALIKTVVSSSPAEKSGLVAGDVITYIDDAVIRSDCDLVIAIRAHEVGDEVRVTYVRDGQTHYTPAVLAFQLKKTISWRPCCDSPETTITESYTPLTGTMSSGLNLYPNPSEGFAQLDYDSTEPGLLKVLVTDMAGRIVFQKEVANFEVAIRNTLI